MAASCNTLKAGLLELLSLVSTVLLCRDGEDKENDASLVPTEQVEAEQDGFSSLLMLSLEPYEDESLKLFVFVGSRLEASR